MLTRREFIRAGLIKGLGYAMLAPPVSVFLGGMCEAITKDFYTKFAIIADMHVTTHQVPETWKLYSKSLKIFSTYIDMVKSMNSLDFLLIPGDLTYDSEPWNHETVKEILDSAGVPYFVVPGNHDVYKNWMPSSHWGIEKFVSTYKGVKGGYDDDRPYYAFEIKQGLVIIGLNSSDTPDGRLRTSWGGWIDDNQLTWLDHELNRHRGKLVLVVVHHTIFPHTEDDLQGGIWENYCIGNSAQLREILRDHQVGIVFSGHHHINHIVQRDGIIEVTNPATCSYPCQIRLCMIKERKLTIRSIDCPHHEMVELAKKAVIKTGKSIPSYPEDTQTFLKFCLGDATDRLFQIDCSKIMNQSK